MLQQAIYMQIMIKMQYDSVLWTPKSVTLTLLHIDIVGVYAFQMADSWLRGKVLEIRKGFGFIAPTVALPPGFRAGRVFFHFSSVQGPRVSDNDEVLFLLDSTKPLKPAAHAIKRADWTGEPRPKRAHSAARSPREDAAVPEELTPKTARTRPNGEESREKKRQQPYQTVSKAKSQKKEPSLSIQEFKSRLAGKIITINKQKNFGFLEAFEDLPAGYPENEHVYFRTEFVENGGLELEVNDILSFSLGTQDKSKPKAMSASVELFHSNRSNAQIEDYVKSLKRRCEEEDSDMYKYVSCDAAWRCLGNSMAMTQPTALMFINVVLTLQEKLQSLQHRYEHIIRVISNSSFLNPWSGTLRTVIEHQHKLRYVDNLGSVKDFLMVVLRAVPEKLSAITCLLKPLLSTDTSSMEHFLYRMLRETTRSIPCEVDDMPWENLPLVPSGKELLDGKASMQPVRAKGAYDSVEQYMDVYFRLFREDCFSALKKGTRNFLNGNLDLRDMNVYHSVRMVGLHLTREDSGLAIAIQVEPLRPVRNWATSSNLMFGNLLCLSVSGSFRDPIWATVAARDVQLLNSKNIIVIELCTESNDMSDSDAIIQLSHGSGKITLAESPTYYRAYQPVLKALQKIQPDDFPFQSQLVEVQGTVTPPAYYQSTTVADTRILHQTKGYKGEVLQHAMWQHPADSMLDTSQYNALCQVFSSPVAVIQGPPGTGKTFIGIKVVELILSMSTVPQAPIVVLTYKNHALDEFLKDMNNKFPGHVARIGGRCKEAVLEKCNLSTLRKDTKKSKALHILMSEKYREADEVKPQVKHAAKTLDQACQYSHQVLFEYATSEQVTSLLVGCNWKHSKLHIQPPITISVVRQYIEAAMSFDSNICSFLQSNLDKEDAHIQKMLIAMVQEAMRQWYPQQSVVSQVERTLGLFTDLDLNLPNQQMKDSPDDVPLQDEKDIEDMERERLAAVSAKSLGKDDIIEFSGLSSTKNTPRLFSTSKAFMAQLPQARLMNVNDLWELSDIDRIKYIQCLLLKNFEEPKQALEIALAKYQRVSATRNELDVQHSIEVLKQKKVIGMTITGASIHRTLLAALQPVIVMVEEAAEVLEPQLIAALSKSVQHLILIGDHKQLRPPVESYELTKHFHFDVSMMERLINNDLPYATLLQQNRMRPEFSKLLLDIYPDLRDNEERVMQNPLPTCMDKSMYFWSHESPEKGGRSYWNEDEAEKAVRLCLFFLQQGYKPQQVTILAAYQGQTSLIRRKMRKEEEKHSELFPIEFDSSDKSEVKQQRVEIHTIDLYQGDENDIVIVSLVRSNPENKVGFVRLLNRRCVAQSRSKCGLYFIGNINTVGSVGHWKVLIQKMNEVACVGPVITLVCPRHPYTTIKAKEATDITLASFCTVICHEMKQCGIHRCTKFCQPTHSHANCDVQVSFRFEKCHHISMKPCSKPVEQMICQQACGKLMNCAAHLCHEKCGDEHSHTYCAERVEFTYTKCGHTNTKHCSQSEENIKCEEEVKINHPVCGHLVVKQCYEEDTSVRCKEPCIKKLSCGHQCNNKCGRPCTQPEHCRSCIRIKEEEEKKRIEAERKAIAEFKAQLNQELEELKTLPVPAVLRTILDPEGDQASEYYEVEDRVKRYVQLKHKWFPEVTRIEKVYNHRLYQNYLKETDNLQDPMHKVMLFHGTSVEAAENIIAKGFKLPKTAGMFGKGIYFATDSSKSAQDMYTKGSNLLLLCEVNLGRCKTEEKDKSYMDSKILQYLGYDSLYAKRNTREKGGVMFDEYVIYRPAQAIVKYIIHYTCTSIPEEHLEKFDFFGTEKSFSKHVLRAKRGRQIKDSTYDTHFRIAESQFLRLTKERNLHLSITEVDYFVNPPLLDKFQKKAAEFQAKYGNNIESEFIPAWHGTKQENIENIVKENFRLEKLSAATGDRGWYGAGIYFSEFPDVSLAYGSQILLCMVLPGKAYDAKHIDRGRLEGQPCQPDYDSHRVEADKEGRGEELVIFNPDQILPCYVVNYERS